jgi:hypothetical protein
MADITVPFNATFGLAAGVESTAIILEDATIKPNAQQSYTALQTFAGGISAAGATFSGTISLNGQTFTNVVSSVNGNTGAVGAAVFPIGVTGSSTIRVITYPDGVTSQRADRSQWHLPYNITLLDTAGFTVYANRTYFAPFMRAKSTTIKSIRFTCENTGITGNCYFSVWSADTNTGYPNTRLYVSASTAIASGYSYNTVTNSGGLVTVPAGAFWIAVTYSSTPIVYSSHKNYMHSMGSPDHTSGYRLYNPIVDTSGFTAPSSISAAGVTFAWVEYNPNTYILPTFQWQAL